MHKLPVFATVGRAYSFLVNECGTIVRLSWLALLLVTLVQYFAARATYEEMVAALEARNLAAASGPRMWEAVSGIFGVVGTAVVAVALHRVILFGDRKDNQYYYLGFGRVELLFVLLPVAIGAIFLALSFLSAESDEESPFVLAAFAVIVFAFFYVMVRLSLIFPIVVVEGRYDFGQAWALTRGNFWRLFATWLVAVIPLLLIFMLLASLFGGLAGVGGMFEASQSDDPVGATLRAAVETAEAAFSFPMIVLGFAFSLVSGAVGVAVLSYSYKFLCGFAPDAILSPPAT
ncbi:MAG: hypothetical protein HXY30_02815 [Pseudorhodoplanes sp.]|nr:hypothetical protein [Pseudorhodoplanes sp.]